MRSVALPVLALVLSLVTALPAAAARADDEAAERASVVVTTEVLGSIVSDLVADTADVTVLMSGGADPHSWQPSARDSEALFRADLVVANGLDLEEGLVAVLEQAEADGVTVFHAAEHVELRGVTTDEVDHDDAQHQHLAGDPHFWLDPLGMRDVVLALGPALADAGVDTEDEVTRLTAELEALDAEMVEILAAVPAERRELVTGHGALGYFADRYDFAIVGTVVPGLSSSDEPSAREVAQLVEAVREAGATAVFSDVGTPDAVARVVADEAGAQIIEVQVAQLPEGGGYAELLRELADVVGAALSGPGD
jgi:zinc/manganese transport system substrate-binding protein